VIPLVLCGVAIYVADEKIPVAGSLDYVRVGALVFAAVMAGIVVLTLLGVLWSFIRPVLWGAA
jgi:hypothetical protein